MSEATRDLASTERYLPIIRRVRRRGLIIIAVAAVVVLIVAVRGATLYAALLPGEMPVRWVDDSSAFRWSSNAPIRWVSAEPSTIFGPLVYGPASFPSPSPRAGRGPGGGVCPPRRSAPNHPRPPAFICARPLPFPRRLIGGSAPYPASAGMGNPGATHRYPHSPQSIASNAKAE